MPTPTIHAGATNKHRYMLASDSRALRRHLNAEVAGIPLIHTNQSRVIVLEPMSEKTRERVQEVRRLRAVSGDFY